jgi:putative ABC transport system substrate-binding protein
VPYNPEDEVAITSIKPLSEVASTLKIELILSEFHTQDEAIAAIKNLPKDMVIFLVPSPSLEPFGSLIEVATQQGLIVGATNHSHLEAGALTSYAADFFAMGEQAARLADQVLDHGVDPGAMPVETAEYFLKLNLKTAEIFDLDIPDDILRQADTIIR